ncbi:hypothetical protein NBRC111894_3713 [Sporolactobacillus inulinus]|uniref:Uncharacterized protein n=1 Tax=Sporolactobacillus inulinus TaxID=2078 RepID=A0A4Y1ZGL2_9BACL|nr:hypothetical protein [Sporolactobacillus inulinus]GAY78159.1 hypothetical protein NBRC111894_3713 [Sporolactobacillus inulinus]
MKKLILMMLGVLLVIALVGCGNADKNSSGAKGETTFEKAKKRVGLRWDLLMKNRMPTQRPMEN